MVEDFNSLFSAIDRTRQKISKEEDDLNTTVDHLDWINILEHLPNIYRTRILF